MSRMIRLAPFAAALALAASSLCTAAHAAEPYAARLFNGNFKGEQFAGFNPNYRISVGDKVTVRLWGAMTFDSAVTVDAQGNIFLPQVGPVKVQSVQNSELNAVVAAAAARTFKSNVGVYAALEAAMPVKVFVTGMARNPGLYAGVSGDSVLRFLDKAGGVDPSRGSYTRIQVMRQGQVKSRVNLYEFLGSGQMNEVPLVDGDTVVVDRKGPSVEISGEVANENEFELAASSQPLSEVLKLAGLKPNATNVTVTHQEGSKTSSEYFDVQSLGSVVLRDGDKVRVTSDTHPATMLVRIEGTHAGVHGLVLSSNATLADALAKLPVDERGNLAAIQLYRPSVAARQKEMLQSSLDSLQAKVLNTSSKTAEESALRKTEAELALQFIERAKNAQPKGQVVLTGNPANILLEDGDVLRVPAKSSLVAVQGEVNLPTALTWEEGKDAAYYIEQAGGLLKSESDARVLVLRQNGSVAEASKAGALRAGDEILVLPQVATKSIEVTRGITQIIYQLAVAARVVIGLL